MQKVYSAAIEQLQGHEFGPLAETTFCPLLNISVCPIAETTQEVSVLYTHVCLSTERAGEPNVYVSISLEVKVRYD